MVKHLKREIGGIEWTGRGISIVDQGALPGLVKRIELCKAEEIVQAIRRLAIRGAPAIGAAGAYAVALAVKQATEERWGARRLSDAMNEIGNCRPTAVNLSICVQRAALKVPFGFAAVLNEAHAIVGEDRTANRAMAEAGADWLVSLFGDRKLRILTHCNTGHLATTGGGTALGVIRALNYRHMIESVYVNETRPLFQGSRLTSWELMNDGIPHQIQVDGATAGTIVGGYVDVAIVGADRIAGNGDFANKIGTLGVALACDFARIPLIVAASTSTIDLDTFEGDCIEIEMRDPTEVTKWPNCDITPEGAIGHNPAFDVTPGRLVSAIVTEKGFWR